MDDLGKLLLFQDVVDAGGFSNAAARRGLSHSTVSKHLKSLEAELGVLLLNRTSRTMSLTQEGSIVLSYSRRVGASVRELRERLDEMRGEVLGELRVNSLVHLSPKLVQPAIRRYLEAFPRSNVQLVLDDGPLEFNRNGYDIAVRVGRNVEGSLTASKLIENNVCIVGAPSLLRRIDAPTHPSELPNLPTVGYQSRDFDITTWSYREKREIRTVQVHPICKANDGRALLDLVLSGLGIGYLSLFAAREHIERGELVQLLPTFVLPPFEPIYMIRATTQHVSPRLRTFARHLRAVAKEAG